MFSMQRFARATRRSFSLLPAPRRRAQWVPLTAVAIGVSSIGALAAARYLDLELEDVKRLVGLGTADLSVAEERELADLAEVSALVTHATSAAFEHPFQRRHVFWRWAFTIGRAFFLVWTFGPVMARTVQISVLGSTPERRERWLESLRAALEQSGAAMIKFGQWASSRPDHFPADLCAALARLRDACPEHSWSTTVACLEADFGRPYTELFSEINPAPVASGSIAQVYHAVLHEEFTLAHGSRDVAVKVRHPRVVGETFVDTAFLFYVMPTLMRVLDVDFKLPFDKAQFAFLLQQQIDLRWEAHNLCTLAHNFAREATRTAGVTLRFPRVSPRLLSEAVLVESWAHGISIDREFGRPAPAPAPRTVMDRVSAIFARGGSVPNDEDVHQAMAHTIFDMYLKMFLRDNFLHGDLHAGNLLFDRETRVITVLDAGIATSIGATVWCPFGDFVRAFCMGNEHAMAESLTRFDSHARAEADRVRLSNDLETDLRSRLQPWRNQGYPMSPGKDVIKGGAVLNSIVESLTHHNIVLRGDVASALLTMSLAETIILSLSPQFDIITNALPYFVRYQGWASGDAVLSSGFSRNSPGHLAASQTTPSMAA